MLLRYYVQNSILNHLDLFLKFRKISEKVGSEASRTANSAHRRQRYWTHSTAGTTPAPPQSPVVNLGTLEIAHCRTPKLSVYFFAHQQKIDWFYFGPLFLFFDIENQSKTWSNWIFFLINISLYLLIYQPTLEHNQMFYLKSLRATENYDCVIVDLFCLLFSSKIPQKTHLFRKFATLRTSTNQMIGWTSPYFNE